MTIVKLLVDNGAQILKPKGDGMNVLHVAASSNDIHLLDYAIKEISRQAKDDLQSTVNSSNFIDLQNQDVYISLYNYFLGLDPCPPGLFPGQLRLTQPFDGAGRRLGQGETRA
jgi:hypothetical protein